MPRKPSLDGKDSSLRIRMSPEQKEKLVSYAERHYQTMSNVIFQALDILYAREEQQNIKSKMELFWSLFLHFFISSFLHKRCEKRKIRNARSKYKPLITAFCVS